MKEYIKINMASPYKILSWTERALPDGNLVGEIKNSVQVKNNFKRSIPKEIRL